MRVYIETYGCALNKSDEVIMRNSLASRGHVLVENIEDADAVVVNTCIVRLDTEYKMVNRIRQLREICSKSGKKLIVTGCMAKVLPYTTSLIAPEASLVSPQNSDKIYIAVESPSRVLLLTGERRRDLIGVCEGRTVPIPIQEGCLGNCTFCIAKHARRRLVSHSVKAVVEAVAKAVEGGAVEIELTGMDLGTYGLDLYGKRMLPSLLREVVSVRGIYKVRLGMINPEHLPYILDELLEVVKNSDKVYKFFHIPLQSGSDRILKLMGRKYTVDEFKAIVKEIKRKIPDASIATDVIIGFPGETDEDFESTLKTIEELRFERVHLAGYSVRPLTLAASMQQVNTRVKKTRMKRALEVVVNVGLKVREPYVGKTIKCFITEWQRSWVGRLDNYIPVVLKTPPEYSSLNYGEYVEVYIDEITFFDIRGHVTQQIPGRTMDSSLQRLL